VRTAVARIVLTVAVLFGAAACGYDTSTTFNADGSVTVSMKFLFPTALMQGGATGSVQGFSASDITAANASLAAKYPGAKITTVTEGTETGAQLTVPFKNEKDAFTFLTTPSQLSPSGSLSGAASSIDLSNTGGLFSAANHTTDGQTDTYTFTTQPTALPSPSPGSQSPISVDELASIFSVTFSLTVPHEITSAPGALFTLDRKTAIWKVSWVSTQAQTFTATTGSGGGVAGTSSGAAQGQSPIIVIGVALVAIVAGFALGMLGPWRRRTAAAPAEGPAAFTPPSVPSATEPQPELPPGTMPGPPPGAPSPPNPYGS
jgi:hypothetical protein